jgi:hypothetical protein
MQNCAMCGNGYDKLMEVKLNGKSYLFDCFECAINKLAPICSNCQGRIIGHGAETSGKFFCSSHCAKAQGADGFVDRR